MDRHDESHRAAGGVGPGRDPHARRRRRRQYRISGQKIFITYGEHDLAPNIVHLVLARIDGAPAGIKGISLFAVPKFLINADGSLAGTTTCAACRSNTSSASMPVRPA